MCRGTPFLVQDGMVRFALLVSEFEFELESFPELVDANLFYVDWEEAKLAA